MEEQKTKAAELVAMEHDVPDSPRTHPVGHRLQGPYSPLEMRMFGKPYALLGSTLKIEDDSVNSVMLDDQPGDNHERVLVAAYVRLRFLLFFYYLVTGSF